MAAFSNYDPLIRSSTGEPGLFSGTHWAARTGLPGHAIQRPNASLVGRFRPLFVGSFDPFFWGLPARFSGAIRPVFRAPNCPVFGAETSSPAPRMVGGVVVSEPIWDDRRGPKTHSRRTGRKL